MFGRKSHQQGPNNIRAEARELAELWYLLTPQQQQELLKSRQPKHALEWLLTVPDPQRGALRPAKPT